MILRLSNALLEHCGIRLPKLTAIFIWIFGLTVLVGLTVVEVYPIWVEYTYKNVGTKIEVIGQNETTKPPVLTFCIPFNSSSLFEMVKYLQENNTQKCVMCTKLADHFLDLNKENFSFTEDINANKDMLAASIVRKLLDTDPDDNFNILRRKYSAWNKPILESLRELFLCIKNNDTENQSPCQLFSLEAGLFKKSKLDKLYDRLILHLLDHMHITIGNGIQLPNSSLLQTPSAIFPKAFCFKLPMSSTGIDIVVDSKSNRDDEQLWNSFPYQDFSFNVYSDTKQLMPGFEDSADHVPMYTSNTEGMAKATRRLLDITYTVQSTVLRREIDPDCYEESTFGECTGSCIISKEIDRFNCIPFTYRKYAKSEYQHFAYCNSSFANGRNLTSKKFKEFCSDKCKNPCEYVSYQWQQNEAIFGNYSNRPVFTLSILPLSFNPYMQFNITARQTREQFISAASGIFNLYFGYSGVVVLGLVIRIVSLFERWLKKKRSSKAASDAGGHVDLQLETEIRQTTDSALDAEMKNLKIAFETYRFDNDTRFDRLEASMEEIKQNLNKLLQNQQ